MAWKTLSLPRSGPKALLVAIGLSGCVVAAETADPVVDPDMMSELMSLHELDEHGVVERLAREQAAAELQFVIERLDVRGYAGSWFDAESGSLHVALTDDAAAARIERLNRQLDRQWRACEHIKLVVRELQRWHLGERAINRSESLWQSQSELGLPLSDRPVALIVV